MKHRPREATIFDLGFSRPWMLQDREEWMCPPRIHPSSVPMPRADYRSMQSDPGITGYTPQRRFRSMLCNHPARHLEDTCAVALSVCSHRCASCGSFRPHSTESTILPSMFPRAARSCAPRASANANVLSMATRRVPAPSKRPISASCAPFERTWVIDTVTPRFVASSRHPRHH